MAMAIPAAIQMMANPEVRKSSKKLIKYLLGFGVLGVAIIAFIFIAKKFNPLKAVGGFLSNIGKSAMGFFGDVGSGIMGGAESVGQVVVGGAESVGQAVVGGIGAAGKGILTGAELGRRILRRESKKVVRQATILGKALGKTKTAKRVSRMISPLRRIAKRKTKDVGKLFASVFARKKKSRKKKKKKKKKWGLW